MNFIVDFKRAFFSLNFILTVLGVLIIYFLGASGDIGSSKDVLFLFKFSGESSIFNMLLIIICTLPFSISFCTDWDSQFIKSHIIRSGVKKYCISKILICFLSSAVSVSIGMAIFCISLSFWYPSVSMESANFTYFSTRTLGGHLLSEGNYISYYLIYIFLGALSCGFWSIIGLFISTKIINKFIAILSPFIIYYFVCLSNKQFPLWLRLNKMTEGMCIIIDTKTTLIYALLLYVILVVLIGIMFIRSVKRRLANG